MITLQTAKKAVIETQSVIYDLTKRFEAVQSLGKVRFEYVGTQIRRRPVAIRPLCCMLIPPPIALAMWLQAAAQDCCEYAVDKALGRERARDRCLEEAITRTIPDINQFELADMIRFLYESDVTNVINEVMDVVWANEFAVWTVDGRMDCIYLHHIGDYRVLEWEREHIDNNGCYQSVPDPCK